MFDWQVHKNTNSIAIMFFIFGPKIAVTVQKSEKVYELYIGHYTGSYQCHVQYNYKNGTIRIISLEEEKKHSKRSVQLRRE